MVDWKIVAILKTAMDLKFESERKNLQFFLF